jgi:hypothetical protein
MVGLASGIKQEGTAQSAISLGKVREQQAGQAQVPPGMRKRRDKEVSERAIAVTGTKSLQAASSEFLRTFPIPGSPCDVAPGVALGAGG